MICRRVDGEKTALSRTILSGLMLAVAVTTAGACGKSTATRSDSGTGDSLVPGTPVALADFCGRFANLAWDGDLACDDPEGDADDPSLGIYVCASLTSEVAAGRIAYDAVEGGRCLHELAAISYDAAFWTLAPSCSRALVGGTPIGGACRRANWLEDNGAGFATYFSECVPGAYCQRSGTSPCDGVCRANVKLGEPCAVQVPCQNATCPITLPCEGDNFCNPVSGLCDALAAEDGACAGPPGRYCRPGLYCRGGTATAGGVCTRQHAEGPCTEADECGLLIECVDATGDGGTADAGTARHCVPWRLARLGEPCQPRGEPICICNTYCSNAGVCTRYPQEGQDCRGDTTDFFGFCERGYCALSDADPDGTCHLLLAPGEHCTYDTECSSQGSCDPSTRVCVPFCLLSTSP